jgi:hypothetical protein
MTTSYDTDPNTHTIAAAWASSPLGQAERDVRDGFATTGPTEQVAASEEEATAKRVMVTAGLACGVAAGALLGVMFFANTDSSQPTVVAPGPAPQYAVVVGPSTAVPAPKPVVSEQSTAPTVVTSAPTVDIPAPKAAPSTTTAVATPAAAPQGGTTVVVPVPIPDYPPLPEKPGQQDPEDPGPEPPKPPVLIDPNFKLPEPKPEPPKPPVFLPDLPLAPVPTSDPVIKLPQAPSPKLNPQPEPPSLPNFIPPAVFGS